MKRNLRYLRIERDLKKDFGTLANILINISTPASFPDSGYYYSQLQTKADRIWDNLLYNQYPKYTHWIKKWEIRLGKRIKRARYEYFELVQLIDHNGREWTAADMDAAMAMS